MNPRPRPEAPGLIDVLSAILSPLIAGVLLVACVIGVVVCGWANRSSE